MKADRNHVIAEIWTNPYFHSRFTTKFSATHRLASRCDMKRTLAFLVVSSALLPLKLPASQADCVWAKVGSGDTSLTFGADTEGSPASYAELFSRPYQNGGGEVAMQQTISAKLFRGSNVELSALLGVSNANGLSSLWIRVMGDDGRILAFDNAHGGISVRPDTSPGESKVVNVIARVPQSASRIDFGAFLVGSGTLQVRNVSFESTTKQSPTALVDSELLQNPYPLGAERVISSSLNARPDDLDFGSCSGNPETSEKSGADPMPLS